MRGHPEAEREGPQVLHAGHVPIHKHRQIENLYKEEIQELKSFYEESLRTKDRKFEIKEELLNERCK